MVKFNSFNFYKRHFNEIQKYIFQEKKILNISSYENKNDLLTNDCKNLFFTSPEFESKLKNLDNNFDLIVVTDYVEGLEDMNLFFDILHSKLKDRGKVLITSVNNKWYPILDLLEFLKLKKTSKKRLHITKKNFINVLSRSSFKFISFHTRQFFPFSIFGFGDLINSFFEILFNKLNFGIKTYFLFQKNTSKYSHLSKSIIIPAKNEEKNLEPLINRIPKFDDLEIIIVCGDSQDNTIQEAYNIQQNLSNQNIQILIQTGNGKANAVFEAINYTQKEIIAILDADISVDPETLTGFFKILENGDADFVNGTRFVYRMESKAMRFINIFGNKAFQKLISFVISKNLTDSLCGTKVFHKDLKEKINLWQKVNKSKDPFGDFDLLFSAAYSGQSMLEYPIHYRRRIYGKTQISRFRDGGKLILYFLNTLRNFTTSIYK